MGIHGQTGKNRAGTLWRLFFEFFKIALFVVGGGYAIIVVADDVFGRRLKWVEEGELIERLPVFQMVPGLIAGNTAIYVGLKMAGMLGAAVALVAVALPSILIFLLVACGYNSLPLGNPWLESAFLGLRSSLTGVIAGTVVAGWRKSVKGAYGYAAVVLGTVALAGGFANTVEVLMAAAAAGLLLELSGLMRVADVSCGVAIDHVWTRRGFFLPLAVLTALFAVSYLYGPLFWIFVKFGLMCFGGGFVLVPAYMDEFVGPGAPLLQLPVEEFSNLMALTQMTPGPVAVNAATFFGYRLGGVGGAVVATAGLLFPGYFLLSGALTSLDKWKSSRIVRGVLGGIRPATVALMLSALIAFGGMSLWRLGEEGRLAVEPVAIVLAAFSAWAVLRRKLSVMATIFICAAAGVAAHTVWGDPAPRPLPDLKGTTTMEEQATTNEITPFGLSPEEAANWRLTFADDFDSPSLDDSKWYAGYRNGQFEYYQRVGATHPGAYTSPECLYEISGGALRLRIDETRPPRPHLGSSCVSCVMTSDHRYGRDRTEATVMKKFGQKYGWFEARCKIAKGPGLESAFWLHQVDPLHQEFTPEGLPNKADGALEFDIFEAWGDPPDALRAQMNVHYTPKGHYRMLEPDPDNDFHVFSLEWEEGRAIFRYDGRIMQTYVGPTPQREMFVLLALFHYRHRPGHVESELTYPVEFAVDYVRVFQRR